MSHLLIVNYLVVFVAFANSCGTILKFYFSVLRRVKYGLTPNINGRDQVTPRFDWLTRRRLIIFSLNSNYFVWLFCCYVEDEDDGNGDDDVYDDDDDNDDDADNEDDDDNGDDDGIKMMLMIMKIAKPRLRLFS